MEFIEPERIIYLEYLWIYCDIKIKKINKTYNKYVYMHKLENNLRKLIRIFITLYTSSSISHLRCLYIWIIIHYIRNLICYSLRIKNPHQYNILYAIVDFLLNNLDSIQYWNTWKKENLNPYIIIKIHFYNSNLFVNFLYCNISPFPLLLRRLPSSLKNKTKRKN